MPFKGFHSIGLQVAPASPASNRSQKKLPTLGPLEWLPACLPVFLFSIFTFSKFIKVAMPSGLCVLVLGGFFFFGCCARRRKVYLQLPALVMEILLHKLPVGVRSQLNKTPKSTCSLDHLDLQGWTENMFETMTFFVAFLLYPSIRLLAFISIIIAYWFLFSPTFHKPLYFYNHNHIIISKNRQ